MQYLGDYAEDDTINFLWSSSDRYGASVTRSTDGTIHVYKNVVAGTETTAGVTDTEDFDSLTGLHSVTILLTDAFYTTGNDYAVVLKAATIDGRVVNTVLAHFSIENRAASIDLANATDGLSALRTLLLDVPTVAEFDARTIVSANYFDPAVDAVATVTTLTGHTAQTGDSFARLGSPAAASIAADLATVQADTDDIQSRLPGALVGGRMDSDVGNMQADTVDASALATDAREEIADQVWDEILTGATHNITNSAGRLLRNLADRGGAVEGIAQAGTGTTITLEAGESSIDDFLNEVRIAIVSGTGAGQTRVIVDYDQSTKVATVHRAWDVNPVSGSVYVYFGSAAVNVVGIGAADTVVNTAAADGLESAGDNYSVTRGLTGTALPAAAADAAGGVPISDAGGLDLDAMDTNINDIETDTAEIGAAGAGLTDLGGMSTGMKAEVESEANDALVAQKLDHLVAVADGDDPVNGSIMAHLASATEDWSTFVPSTDSLQALRDRGDTAWITGGGTGLSSLASGTAQAGATGTITLAAGESATNDLFNGARILVTAGTGAGQARIITDYVGSSKVASIAPDWTTPPSSDSVYEIQAADAAVGWWRGAQPLILSSGRVDSRASDIASGAIGSAQFASGAIGAAAIAANAIGSSELADSAAQKIRDEILSDSTPFAGADVATILVDTADMQPKIGTPSADLAADVAAVKAETALIVADTNELQSDDVPGLIAALNDLSAAGVNAEVDTALADIHLDHLLAVDYDPASPPGIGTALLNELIESNGGVSRYTAAALSQAPGGSAPTVGAIADAVWDEATADHVGGTTFGALKVDSAAILIDTAEIGAAGAGLSDLGGMSTGMKAEVNVEAKDVINVDTITLLGQEAPPLAPTLLQALGWLYKLARNRVRTTATTMEVLADDETTVDHKATVSDDATTALRQEWGAGP